jgi:hypothetical protein
MKATSLIFSALLIAPLAACDDMDTMDTMDAPPRSGSAAAESACVQAVNTNYGRSVAQVTSSSFSQAATAVMLTAEGETWKCLSSEDGRVDDLRVVG